MHQTAKLMLRKLAEGHNHSQRQSNFKLYKVWAEQSKEGTLILLNICLSLTWRSKVGKAPNFSSSAKINTVMSTLCLLCLQVNEDFENSSSSSIREVRKMKLSLIRGPRFKVGNTPGTASSWLLTEYFKWHIKAQIIQNIFTVFIYQLRKLFLIEPWNLEYLSSTLPPPPPTIPWGKYKPHLTFQQKNGNSNKWLLHDRSLYIDIVICIFSKLFP